MFLKTKVSSGAADLETRPASCRDSWPGIERESGTGKVEPYEQQLCERDRKRRDGAHGAANSKERVAHTRQSSSISDQQRATVWCAGHMMTHTSGAGGFCHMSTGFFACSLSAAHIASATMHHAACTHGRVCVSHSRMSPAKSYDQRPLQLRWLLLVWLRAQR